MRRDPRQEAIRALVAPNRAVTQVIPVEESEYPLSFLKNFPISQYAYLLPEERWFAFLIVVSRQKPATNRVSLSNRTALNLRLAVTESL